MNRKYLLLIVVSAVSLFLDQITKIWIRGNIPEGGRSIEVIDGYFRIIHAENRGAAWGILNDVSWRIPFFIVVTLIAIGVIIHYYRQLPDDDRLQGVGLSLILGGALGNFIDRVMQGSVTDFIEVYIGQGSLKPILINIFGSYRWPAFNIADAAIVGGIGMILYHIFVVEPRLAKAEAAASEGEALPEGD